MFDHNYMKTSESDECQGEAEIFNFFRTFLEHDQTRENPGVEREFRMTSEAHGQI